MSNFDSVAWDFYAGTEILQWIQGDRARSDPLNMNISRAKFVPLVA